MKQKIYYVEIRGRANTIHGKIRGKELHHETIVAESQKKAREEAWNNFYCDMTDFDKAVYTRRDFKIECEDWTDSPEIIRDSDYYFTSELIKPIGYRFKAGDKVRIKVTATASENALKHQGEVVTIKEKCSFAYAYLLEELPDLWQDGRFEKADEEV